MYFLFREAGNPGKLFSVFICFYFNNFFFFTICCLSLLKLLYAYALLYSMVSGLFSVVTLLQKVYLV